MAPDSKDPAPSSLAPADGVRIALTTAPPGEAHALARALVEERLAACVNVVPGLRSVYRWKDGVSDEPETLLLIKTTAGGLEALAGRLAALHPYEVPELLTTTPDAGFPAYLAWVGEQVAKP
jgi:periplasmic divalent cation tolerance protein